MGIHRYRQLGICVNVPKMKPPRVKTEQKTRASQDCYAMGCPPLLLQREEQGVFIDLIQGLRESEK